MNILAGIDKEKLLPLISAAAVLRKADLLRKLLSEAKLKKLSSKKIYEALLQTYLFAGFPSALVSLSVFNEFFKSPKAQISDSDNFFVLGEKTCKRIYGDKYEKLISNVNGFSPELSHWLVREGYGKVLSRSGLSLKEREKSIISVLSVQKFESQLFSHINGAVKVGVKIPEIEEVFDGLIFFGNNSFRAFGYKILKKFRSQKGI